MTKIRYNVIRSCPYLQIKIWRVIQKLIKIKIEYSPTNLEKIMSFLDKYPDLFEFKLNV